MERGLWGLFALTEAFPAALLGRVVLQASRRPVRTAFLLLLLALLLAVAADGPAAVAQTPGSLVWRACGGGFECTTLSVPLDYAAPQARRIDIALIRLRARDASARIGPLLVNPGGPGGSGIDFLRRWAALLPGQIRDRFDVISFDPRGVGESTPLLCHDNIQALMALPPAPASEEVWRQVQDAVRGFAELCASRAGGMLPYLGTLNAARDMDEIRKALGEDRISYLGYSYGTVLGAVYADLFPNNVRALVLDGAVDLSLDGETFLRYQAAGFEAAFARYLQWCRARQCLGAGDPAEAVRLLLARAEDAPIAAPQADRPAGPGEITFAMLAGLYSDALWGELTSGLNAARAGNASGLIRLADRLAGRRADGTYDNSSEMNAAVNCLDHDFGREPRRHIALAEELGVKLPFFGSYVGQGGLACAYWAAEPQPLKAPRAAGAPPTLVIGTTGDPATPYVWAQAMASQLESAVLLTFRAEGHTAYRRGDNCIDSAVNAYLLTLQMPPPGTACGNPALAEPLPLVVETPQPPSPAETPPAPVPPPDGDGLAGGNENDGSLARALAGALVAALLVTTVAIFALRLARR